MLTDAAPIRLALVGLGDRGNWHLRGIERCTHVDLVGVADPDPRAEVAIGRRVPRFTTWTDLVERTEPDAVIVSVPHDLYLEIVPALLRRGLWVMQDKPVAESISRARAIYADPTIDTSRLTFAVQRRFSASYAHLADQIAHHGPPISFSHTYHLALNRVVGDWRRSPARSGGGVLFDLGFHVIDQLVHLLGHPVASSTHVQTDPELSGPDGVIEHLATGSLVFPGGTIGTFHLSLNLRPRTELLQMWWPDRMIAVDFYGRVTAEDGDSRVELADVEDRADLLHAVVDGFLDHIRGRPSKVTALEDALKVMEVVDDLRRSALG